MTEHSGDWNLYIKDDRKIIELLISELYGDDPVVSVREILQNAHDACLSLNQARGKHEGVTVGLGHDTEGDYIEVRDTGIGLNKDDLRNKLLAIGESDKSVWTDATDENSLREIVTQQNSAIGKFGIGFLASFILAHRVRVRTWRFCGGDSSEPVPGLELNCRLREIPPPTPLPTGPVGTEIRLYIREQRTDNVMFNDRVRELKRPDSLKQHVAKLMYFSQVPIYFRSSFNSRDLVSTENDDIAAVDPEKLQQLLFGEAMGKPLAAGVYPLDMSTGGKPDGHVFLYAWSGTGMFDITGQVNIWVQGMLVEQGVRSCLPAWAACFTAQVSAGNLPIELDRRSVQVTSVQFGRLRDQLLDACLDLFERVVEKHDIRIFHREIWPKLSGMVLTQALRDFDDTAHRDPFERKAAQRFLKEAGPNLPLRVLRYNDRIKSYAQDTSTLKDIFSRMEKAGCAQPYKIPYLNTEGTVGAALSLEIVGSEIVLDARPTGRDDSRKETIAEAFIKAMQRAAKGIVEFSLIDPDANMGGELKPEEMRQGWESLRQFVEANTDYGPIPGTARRERYETRVRRFEPHYLPMVALEYSGQSNVVDNIQRALANINLPENVRRRLVGSLEGDSLSGRALIINANNSVMQKLATLISGDVGRAISNDSGFSHLLFQQIEDARIDYYGGSAIGGEAQAAIYRKVRLPLYLDMAEELEARLVRRARLEIGSIPELPAPEDVRFGTVLMGCFAGVDALATSSALPFGREYAQLGLDLGRRVQEAEGHFLGLDMNGFMCVWFSNSAILAHPRVREGHFQVQTTVEAWTSRLAEHFALPRAIVQPRLAMAHGTVTFARHGRAGAVTGVPVAKARSLLLEYELWDQVGKSNSATLLEGGMLSVVDGMKSKAAALGCDSKHGWVANPIFKV